MSDEPIQLDTTIRFFISVPDGSPEAATPFQGFAHSLCERSMLLSFIQQMPVDVFELTPERLPSLIARRIAGQSPVSWFGQSPRALRSLPMPVEAAFTVIMLDQGEQVADYQDWLDTCPGPVTIVADKGGTIPYSKLSFEALRQRFLDVCDELKKAPNILGVQEAEAAIRSWTDLPEKRISYPLQGHGTIEPNVAALRVCGYRFNFERFNRLTDGEQPYLDQIVKTTNNVFDEREKSLSSEANLNFPKQPDLNLYLPSTYDTEAVWKINRNLDQVTRKYVRTSLQILEKQSSYKFDLSGDYQIEVALGMSVQESQSKGTAKPNAIINVRQSEIRLGTKVVACLAASEVSAVVRLPPRLNHSRGVVRQFAEHYRADKPQMLKRAELFRGVQRAIADGFPTELRSLLDRSRDGIRILADAHVEWLDVEGIPLGLRYDVSRVPVTPGNLFINTLSAKPPIFATPASFHKILVVSGLLERDIVARQFTEAFEQFGKHWQGKLDITFVRATSRRELVEAINAFDGMMMFFDGHGSHKPNEPGVIWLDEEKVDVWDLSEEILQVPPIVMLSACDTHAADRNHATVANGFLSLGCRSVIASVFPLHASPAAVFAARLLFRVCEYIPAAIGLFKRSLTWLEVVSGMLRRQLMTDILRELNTKKLIAAEDFLDMHENLCALVDLYGGEAFHQARQILLEYGIPDRALDSEIRGAIAASSTISYLHIGRPETIVINSQENLAALVDSDS